MSNLRVLRELEEQNLEEPLPTQVSREPVQLSQDEEENFERQVRPRLEPLGIRPNHARLDSNARALVILLEIGKANPLEPETLFGGCFEGRNEDQILGWDVSTTEVLAEGHRRFLRGPVEPVAKEQRTAYIASLLQRILDFLRM